MIVDPQETQAIEGALAVVCLPEKLRLGSIERLCGPSPEAPSAAIICRLETGPDLPPLRTLLDQLSAAFPREFGSTAKNGRSKETKAADIAECAARLAGRLLDRAFGIAFGFGAVTSGKGKALLWVELFDEPAALQALKVALVAVGAAISGEDPGSATSDDRAVFARLSAQRTINLDSQILIGAARRRGIPVLQIAGNHALWQYGWGSNSQRFWVTSSDQDGVTAQRLAHDKNSSKHIFVELGVPTSPWRLVGPGDDIGRAAAAVGWPCVVKPYNLGSGVGVSANIGDRASLDRAVAVARRLSSQIIIEAHVPGDGHRLMVVDGRLIAAVRSDPAAIVGDGKRSVAELVEAFNVPRQGDPRDAGFLTPVPLDAGTLATLAAQDVGPETVLTDGQKILLRTTSNRSSGATSCDVLDQVHPQIGRLAERIAAAFGFRATGVDYITTDISRSHDEVGGAFLETNTTPGLRVLLTAGIAEEMLAEKLLGPMPGRIPVILLLAPAGLLGEIEAALEGRLPASAAAASPCSDRIGGFTLPPSELAPPERVAALLRYPTVERLLVLWSAEELLRFGLPVDRLDATILVGEKLPREWLALLTNCSGEVARVVDASDALERALSGGTAPPRHKRRANG